MSSNPSSRVLDRWGPIWSPPALAHLVHAPVFLFRPATADDAGAARAVIVAEGLPYHDVDAFRAEALAALAKLWPVKTFAHHAARLRRMWIRIDAGQKLKAADQRDFSKLMADLTGAWAPFGRMVLDNSFHTLRIPITAASMLLIGWVSFDLTYSHEGGRTPLALLEAAGLKLEAIERAAGLEPGVAFAELKVEAAARIHLAPAGAAYPTIPNPEEPE